MVGSTRSMRVVSPHHAVLDRHVEVDADQHALARDVEPSIGLDAREVQARGVLVLCIRRMRFVHINLPMTTAVSLMRLEKPHSLSYQATTRQNVPSTTGRALQIEDRAHGDRD